MQPLQTIVLASDFSDQSRGAEEYARMLAQKCGATLNVVHAIEPIMGVEDEDSHEFEEFYRRLIDRAEHEVEARIAAWGDRLIVKQHIRIGPRWKTVLEVADEENADLVVLGRRSYTSSNKRAPIGTTSQKVFFGASRPVLFVPTE